MGANATTKVPSYVAGQVLTAADLSITNSGIPVFANSTDRTNSFGGTGEKTLAEGQFAYLEDDNKTYVYDGSAWQEVGGSGVVLISSTTVGSAVSSVTVSNAFSSSYDNYLIIFAATTGSTSTDLRFQISGSTANYAYSTSYTSTGGTVTNKGSASDSSFVVGGSDGGTGNSVVLTVMGPQLSTRTTVVGQAIGNSGSYFMAGQNIDSTARTGFVFSPVSGTITGGIIKVYGYKN